MKKVIYLSVVFAGSLFITSCGSSDEGVSTEDQGITMLADDPCSGPEFKTNGEVIRGIGSGESMNKNSAQKKAKSNAINEIASTLNTVFQSVTTNYLNDRTENDLSTVRGKLEDMQKTLVDQEVRGAHDICTKYGTRKNSQGVMVYICYTSYELSAASIADKYYQNLKTLSEDAELRIDYDYENYKEDFKQEMENLKNRRN